MWLEAREITVAGAGIAGLAVACALAQRGARVRVLEQAPDLSEVGAGLQVSPNGWRVIEALGLGAALGDVATESGAVVLRSHATGGEVLRMPLAGRGRFGLVHRADLLAVLRAGAEAAGVAIETGARVASVFLGRHGALLEMADGGRRSVPFLVGADGLRSRLRAALMGDVAPAFTGQVAWRALVDAPPGIAREAHVFMGPGRHVVAYPLRDGRLLNLVAVEERKAWAAEGWHHAGDADALRRAFAEFGGPVPGWLSRVETPMIWGLFRHPVATRWWAPGVALIGDAAHPTLPFLAQGANMALEDAWTLAAALDSGPDEAVLPAWQAARAPRCDRIVEAATANARNYHLRGVRRVVGHALLRRLNRTAPGRALDRFDWLYGFDPTGHDAAG
jgi:salicylate hydroxylase